MQRKSYNQMTNASQGHSVPHNNSVDIFSGDPYDHVNDSYVKNNNNNAA